MSVHIHSIAEAPDGKTPPSLGSIGGENTLAALATSVADREKAANRMGIGDEAVSVHTDAADCLAMQMANIPANTPRGIMAKLRAYRLVVCNDPAYGEYADEKLLASLLLDLDRFFAGA